MSVPSDGLEPLAIMDPYKAVEVDIEALRANPAIPESSIVENGQIFLRRSIGSTDAIMSSSPARRSTAIRDVFASAMLQNADFSGRGRVCPDSCCFANTDQSYRRLTVSRRLKQHPQNPKSRHSGSFGLVVSKKHFKAVVDNLVSFCSFNRSGAAQELWPVEKSFQ
nr:hypothetical protein [Agrobacterium sp. rho-8.1]